MSGLSRSSLRFESLESKQMLAGDVVVSVIHGNLLIEGDAEANSVVVAAGETAGTLVVQGLDGTNVRFADAEPTDPPAPASGLVVEGVRGNVRIGLGEGNDTLAINDVALRRNLTINTGDGEDVVRIGVEDGDADSVNAGEASVRVGGSVSIRTGEGNDQVEVDSAKIGGLLSILTDGGNDTVNLGAESSAPISDEDVDVTLRAGMGISVALGDGEDGATLNDVATRGGVIVGGGDGADTIALADVAARVLGIRGGADDAIDTVQLTGLKGGHAVVELGGGADVLSIVDSAFQSLAVALGSGDDALSISTVSAKRALLAGGEGDGDELTDAGDNAIERLVIAGFEVPADVNTDPLPSRPGRPGHGGVPLGRLAGRRR